MKMCILWLWHGNLAFLKKLLVFILPLSSPNVLLLISLYMTLVCIYVHIHGIYNKDIFIPKPNNVHWLFLFTNQTIMYNKINIQFTYTADHVFNKQEWKRYTLKFQGCSLCHIRGNFISRTSDSAIRGICSILGHCCSNVNQWWTNQLSYKKQRNLTLK